MTIQQTEVVVSELSNNGNGLGVIIQGGQNIACEIPFTIPGDVVNVEINQPVDGKIKTKLKSIVSPSPLRISPRCSHFSVCGGCHFQHMPYKAQLLHKENIIRKCFAGLLSPGVTVHPIAASKSPWHYRGKMHCTFGFDSAGQQQLGLVQEGTKGCIVNIKECSLTPSWFMDALICVKRWWDASKIPPYDPVNNKGVLRNLTLREGRRSGDRMVILTVENCNDFDLGIRHIEKFVSQVVEYARPHQGDSQLSVFLRVCQTGKGIPSSHYEMLLYGSGFVREGLKMDFDKSRAPENLVFEVGPSAFFQPNPQQTELFYSRALELAKIDRDSVVYDLYCGAGIVGLCASKYAKQVIGVDVSSESISNARKNAELNKCTNISFYAGANRHVLGMLEESGTLPPTHIILTPPRVGCDPKAIERILEIKAPVILYISCRPDTQAANVQTLVDNGYRLTDIQPVDQFPQTNHMGNIAILSL